MHLGIPALLDYYRARRGDDSLVLATIIGTEGSTYRKTGAMMLIGRDGSYEGMISGGCLEGDLLHHADAVFETGTAAFHTYDMHADEELVWNLGLGCDGVIHLMLQRLDPEAEFGFLGPLEKLQRERRAALLALVTRTDGALAPGAFGIIDISDISVGEPVLLELLLPLRAAWPGERFRYADCGREGRARALVINIAPPTRVLLCGAGPDAVPMAAALAALGWEVLVADHRPAFLQPGRFAAGCRLLQCRPGKLAERIGPGDIDAAVVMSHHLENDAAYLGGLAPLALPYVGILGPRARRDRLLEMVGLEDEGGVAQTVYGPVGLDIGAELPTAIALATAAEIHAVLNGRDGRPLTRRADRDLEGHREEQ